MRKVGDVVFLRGFETKFTITSMQTYDSSVSNGLNLNTTIFGSKEKEIDDVAECSTYVTLVHIFISDDGHKGSLVLENISLEACT